MVANKEAFDHQLNSIEGGFEWYKLRHFESPSTSLAFPFPNNLSSLLPNLQVTLP